jgi:hypothetical protein
LKPAVFESRPKLRVWFYPDVVYWLFLIVIFQKDLEHTTFHPPHAPHL